MHSPDRLSNVSGPKNVTGIIVEGKLPDALMPQNNCESHYDLVDLSLYLVLSLLLLTEQAPYEESRLAVRKVWST